MTTEKTVIWRKPSVPVEVVLGSRLSPTDFGWRQPAQNRPELAAQPSKRARRSVHLTCHHFARTRALRQLAMKARAPGESRQVMPACHGRGTQPSAAGAGRRLKRAQFDFWDLFRELLHRAEAVSCGVSGLWAGWRAGRQLDGRDGLQDMRDFGVDVFEASIIPGPAAAPSIWWTWTRYQPLSRACGVPIMVPTSGKPCSRPVGAASGGGRRHYHRRYRNRARGSEPPGRDRPLPRSHRRPGVILLILWMIVLAARTSCSA